MTNQVPEGRLILAHTLHSLTCSETGGGCRNKSR
jgi:hypothetical protein